MSTKFVEYGGKRFPLDDGMTLEQAKDVMARHFPELAEQKVETKKDGEITVYVFTKQAGRKGAGLDIVCARLSKIELAGIEYEYLDIARAEGEPQTPHTADDLRSVAGDMVNTAQVVRQIGDALLSTPTSARPAGSIL